MVRPTPKRTRSVSSPESCAQLARNSEIHPPSPAPHMSARRSSSSIWTGERSTTFARDICVSWVHVPKGSIARNARCSLCCVRGEFDERELPRELPLPFRYAPRPPFILFRRQYQWHERPFSFATS